MNDVSQYKMLQQFKFKKRLQYNAKEMFRLISTAMHQAK